MLVPEMTVVADHSHRGLEPQAHRSFEGTWQIQPDLLLHTAGGRLADA